MLQKLYRFIFWSGYVFVLVTAFIPIAGDLTKTKIGYGITEIRLDHLLHLSAYFLICMYYLAGSWKRLMLFNDNARRKFMILVLLLATVTELVQLWVPERAFNILDWVANIAGIMVGFLVIKSFALPHSLHSASLTPSPRATPCHPTVEDERLS